jgi:hypothetical protein
VGEFGEKFRKAREKKEFSLDDVSKVTKIGTRMLQAIEEENFDRLPGGVFNKGFIRAFAKCVGLDEQETINEYLECLRQEQVSALSAEVKANSAPEPAKHQAHKSASKSSSASTGEVGKDTASKATEQRQSAVAVQELSELHLPRMEDVRRSRREFSQSRSGIPWRLVIAAIVVVALAGLLWQRRSHKVQTLKAAAAAPAAVSIPASTAALNTDGKDSGAAARTAQKSPVPQPGAMNNVEQPGPLVPRQASTPQESEVTTKGPKLAAPVPPAEKAPATLKLVIRADENSWISVAADGQTVSQETLIAPASTSVRARQEIVVKVGNAAGVTFVWNGQEIQPGGGESEVKTFVFDASGMRVAGAAQATPPPGIP